MGRKTKKGKERLDKYYQLAKDQGFRARSAFKLIQLAKKTDFLSRSRVAIDLCAAPGGWSQVAQRNMPAGSLIIAVDLMPMKPIHGVTCIQSDITTDKCRSLVRKELANTKADVVLHDGAPNVGTSWTKDAYGQNELTLMAMKVACEHLRPGGTFVTKVFRSQDYNSLLWVFHQLFGKVDATKPTASRNVSAETFVICSSFKAGQIDQRFFEPKWVFMEKMDAIGEGARDKEHKKPGAWLSDYVKNAPKRHRGGYEPGDDNKFCGAQEFLDAKHPAELLVTHHWINLEAPGSEEIAKNPLTTEEVRDLCKDLKVLGRRDLSTLLKWRMKLLREKEKAERERKKAEEKAAKLRAAALRKAAKQGLALEGGTLPLALAPGEEAADTAKEALRQDVDEAIAQFLDGAKGAEVEEELDSEEEAAKIDEEIAELVEKRRREEHKETKQIANRQKKQEWRKKMALQSKGIEHDGEETGLFKGGKATVEALALEDDLIDPRTRDSGAEEDSDKESEEESSTDDEGLDRYAKMEVDLAVQAQLHKAGYELRNRKKVQRKNRAKKETRREKVAAAWAGEINAFNESINRQLADQQMAALKDGEEEDDADDDDDDEEDLQALRELQRKAALKDSEAPTVDVAALEASLAGPQPSEALRALADEQAAQARGAKEEDADAAGGAEEGSTALMPLGQEEQLRSLHRANRWFSQDIFKGITAKVEDGLLPLDRDSDEETGDGKMIEKDDKELPKLPLTDRQKRKLKRQQEQERLDKLHKRRKAAEAEDRRPLEVAPLEAPKPLVTISGPLKPTDPQELAETLALGSLLVESKKSRMELIDAAYNRWTFDGDEALPDWFTEDENRHNKPELPITKELMAQYRAKLREINARPIRKVAEARARKQKRLKLRLEKLRKTAMSLADQADLSESAKARQMRKLVGKAMREQGRKVSTIAVKKGGGGKSLTKNKGVPKGAKVKVVDKRLKSDTRSQKRSLKRASAKSRAKNRKQMKKMQGKKKGGSANRAGGGKKNSGGKGVYGSTA